MNDSSTFWGEPRNTVGHDSGRIATVWFNEEEGVLALVVSEEQGGRRVVVGVQVTATGWDAYPQSAGVRAARDFIVQLGDDLAGTEVTTTALRALGLGRAVALHRVAAARATESEPSVLFSSPRWGDLVLAKEQLAGVNFLPDAYDYAVLTFKGDSNPSKTIAEKRGRPLRTQQGRIRQAREQGLLTPAVKGRAGGLMTRKARVLYEQGREAVGAPLSPELAQALDHITEKED